MNIDLLIAILIGILSGWTVVIFSDTYHEFKQKLLVQLGPKAKFSKIIVESISPLIFLLFMFILVLLVFYLKSK